jgi:hypothetical protein
MNGRSSESKGGSPCLVVGARASCTYQAEIPSFFVENPALGIDVDNHNA